MDKFNALDFIIVGQGLAGSLLAYELLRRKKNVIIIDSNKKNTCSKIAAGIMLPITGRRLVKTWKADTLIPFSNWFYSEIEAITGQKVFYSLPLVEIYSSTKNRNDWLARSAESGYENYIGEEIIAKRFSNFLNTEFGGITIKNTGFLKVDKFIELLQNYFQKKNIYKIESFSFDNLVIKDDSVAYENFHASKIIFCEGAYVVQNPFLKQLPFLPAKGEILKIYCEELPENYIINSGMYILPLGNHKFKAGATFEWNYGHDQPSHQGKEQIDSFLKKILKINFNIISHEAAIRPTLKDRRPIIGLHPRHKCIGIFNGLGTKGVMLAPYFARQFADFLDGKCEIENEVDVKRFF